MAEEVTLKAKDGNELHIKAGAAKLSETIAGLLEVIDVSEVLPLEKVESSATLEQIVRYLTFHFENPLPKSSAEESFAVIEDWDKKFLEENEEKLTSLIDAADYLQIHSLLLLAAGYIGKEIKGLTALEVREKYKLSNDLTEEEIATITKEDEEFFKPEF